MASISTTSRQLTPRTSAILIDAPTACAAHDAISSASSSAILMSAVIEWQTQYQPRRQAEGNRSQDIELGLAAACSMPCI
jgi:hypothetical protein